MANWVKQYAGASPAIPYAQINLDDCIRVYLTSGPNYQVKAKRSGESTDYSVSTYYATEAEGQEALLELIS